MAADKPPQLRPRTRKDSVVFFTLFFGVVFVLSAILLTGISFLQVFLDRKFPATVLTVAITGVTGLAPEDPVVLLRDVVDTPTISSLADDDDYGSSPAPALAPPPTAPTTFISPAFNLTFQIDNRRNSQYVACVPGLSRADVSYGDAFFLAGASVPPLCAGEERRSDGVAATASGENVAVPRFVMDQLLAAGDASVDVKLTMPTYCRYGRCRGAVFYCKAKIGGGTSPACRLDPPRSAFCVLFNEACD